MMKALKTLFFTVSLVVAMTLSLSATANTVAQTAKHANTTKTKASKQFMFVASAATGSIHRLKGDSYVLYLDLNDIKQILLYTQRPDRIYRYVKRQGLKQAWYGKDNLNDFSRNPPNAVLATQDAIPSVVTITHMGIVQGGVVFVFHPIRPGMFHIPTGKLSEVALTIDAVASATESVANNLDPMSGLQSLGDQGPLQVLTLPTGPTQLVQHEAMSKLTEAIKGAIQKGKAARAAKAKAKAKNNSDEDEDSSDEASDEASDEVSDEASDAAPEAAGDAAPEIETPALESTADTAAGGAEGAELSSDLGSVGAVGDELADAGDIAATTGATTEAVAAATDTAVVGGAATEAAATDIIEMTAGAAAAVAGE